jgi:GTP-binding protein
VRGDAFLVERGDMALRITETHEAVHAGHYPEPTLPEVAFIGRSNVGKSSLLKAMTGAGKEIRISSTPGCTRKIYFYDMDQRLRLVDLPGYGWAGVPRELRAQWKKMIFQYFRERETLAGVVLLLDVRREPSDDDNHMLEWLSEEGIPVCLVVTKLDKVPKAHRFARMNAIADQLSVEAEHMMGVSSVTAEGCDALWQALHELTETG